MTTIDVAEIVDAMLPKDYVPHTRSMVLEIAQAAVDAQRAADEQRPKQKPVGFVSALSIDWLKKRPEGAHAHVTTKLCTQRSFETPVALFLSEASDAATQPPPTPASVPVVERRATAPELQGIVRLVEADNISEIGRAERIWRFVLQALSSSPAPVQGEQDTKGWRDGVR